MKDLMLILAKLAPEETILTMISEGLEAYKVLPSEDNKKKLQSACLLFVTRVHTEDRSLETAMSDFDKVERASNLLNTNPA